MRIFLAGIIQGSHAGSELHDQGYREELKTIIYAQLPEAEIVCPVELHPNSIEYGTEQSRLTFLAMIEEAKTADVVIAYLPAASMGTAVEMWEAYNAGRPVLSITPLRHNWVINLLSHRVFHSLGDFAAFIAAGELTTMAAE